MGTKYQFYEELSEAITQVGYNREIIASSDLNAIIEKSKSQENNWTMGETRKMYIDM